MFRKIALTFRILVDYIKNIIIGDGVLVGMDAKIDWDEPSPTEINYYLSFSADPINRDWDDFGVLDSDIFFYLDGIKESIKFLWKRNHDGWLIIDGSLVISSTAE